VIAGASVAAALNGLEYAAIHKYDLFTKIHAITGSDKVSHKHNYKIIKLLLQRFSSARYTSSLAYDRFASDSQSNILFPMVWRAIA